MDGHHIENSVHLVEYLQIQRNSRTLANCVFCVFIFKFSKTLFSLDNSAFYVPLNAILKKYFLSLLFWDTVETPHWACSDHEQPLFHIFWSGQVEWNVLLGTITQLRRTKGRKYWSHSFIMWLGAIQAARWVLFNSSGLLWCNSSYFPTDRGTYVRSLSTFSVSLFLTPSPQVSRRTRD